MRTDVGSVIDLFVYRIIRIEAMTCGTSDTLMTLPSLTFYRYLVAEDHRLPLFGRPVLIAMTESKSLLTLLIGVVQLARRSARWQPGCIQTTTDGILADW